MAETALPLAALRDWMINGGRLSEFLEANPDISRGRYLSSFSPSFQPKSSPTAKSDGGNEDANRVKKSPTFSQSTRYPYYMRKLGRNNC